jgi:hypothetical protein
MPRRAAVRMLAVSIAGAAIGGLRPSWARAEDGCGPGAKACGGSSLDCYRPGRDTCCPSRAPAPPEGSDVLPDIPNGVCCYDDRGNANPLLPGWQCCTGGEGCPPDGACCRRRCCPSGQYCANPTLELCCKQGTALCGRLCCTTNQECLRVGSDRRCVQKCPQRRARCGPEKCCPPNRRCANPSTGRCSPCDTGQQACGRKCCARGSTCCDPRTSLCCKRNETCSGYGGTAKCCPKGSTACDTSRRSANPICCQKGEVCAQITDPSGTVPASLQGRNTCCPPERVVPGNTKTCCPVGYLSLGGRLILPEGGGGGLCCRNDKVCGNTCCGTNSDPGINSTCCNGRCVSLYFDAQNCGSCGRRCTGTQRCDKGTCLA